MRVETQLPSLLWGKRRDLGFNHDSCLLCGLSQVYLSSFWVSVTSFLGWGDMDSIGMFWELNEILWFLATVLVLSHHLNVILLSPLSSALCPQYTPYYFPSCWSAFPTTFFQICVMNVALEKWLIWEEALLDMSVWNVPRERVYRAVRKITAVQNSSLLLPVGVSALVGNRKKNYLFSINTVNPWTTHGLGHSQTSKYNFWLPQNLSRPQYPWGLVPGPPTDTKIYGCSRPLYKVV